MMMLIQRICIAFRGFSKWNMVEAAMRERAATDLQRRESYERRWIETSHVLSWNLTKLVIL